MMEEFVRPLAMTFWGGALGGSSGKETLCDNTEHCWSSPWPIDDSYHPDHFNHSWISVLTVVNVHNERSGCSDHLIILSGLNCQTMLTILATMLTIIILCTVLTALIILSSWPIRPDHPDHVLTIPHKRSDWPCRLSCPGTTSHYILNRFLNRLFEF